MKNIVIERKIKAPIERVFDMLADHANWKEFPGVSSSIVVKKGSPDPDGLGAIREIKAGGVFFEERITAFERPVRMDYLITKARPSIEHKGGSIRLKPTANGDTELNWTTTLRFDTPVVGGLITSIALPKLEKAIRAMLQNIEDRLTR
jgi:uncharacterized protein YndB with AHSA1/START domain